MGVPKTIDNDLDITDHTPGFGSAAKYIASITKEIIRDGLVYDLDSVTIIQMMGRNAGWLAGAAALAKENTGRPDMIFLPEVEFDMDQFIEKVRKLQETKRSVVIAVSEGIRLADGRYVAELGTELGAEDAFGHKILTGAATYLSREIGRRIGCKSRAIEFNTLQDVLLILYPVWILQKHFKWGVLL